MTALLYPGAVNALNGESGGGKSWIALAAAAQTIAAGGTVVFIDLEDTPASIVHRLRALGVADHHIRERFVYIRPDQPLGPEAALDLDQHAARADLIIIDSIGELMALQGVKPNDDDAVARFYRAIPRPLSRHGAAVLLIDHVPKNNENSPLYGIGSQRKRAAIDGASYMVQTIRTFAKGRPGAVKLVVAKDRHGTRATGTVAAIADIAGDDQAITIDLHEPDRLDDGRTRPTHNMSRLADALRTHGGAASVTELRGAGVRAADIPAALDALIVEGYVARIETDGKAARYRLDRPFDIDLTPPKTSRR